MYIELTFAARSVAETLIAKKRLRLSIDRVEDVAADISLRIAKRFLTRDYRVKNWYTLIYLDAKSVLFYPPQKKIDSECDLSGIDVIDGRHSEPQPRSEAMYLADVLSDREIDGRRIVKDLFVTRLKKSPRSTLYAHHESEYKAAVLKIAEYTPRQHIYRLAVELRTIFDTLRIREGDS